MISFRAESTGARRPFALGLLAAMFVAACGESAGPTRFAAPLRLVDRLDEARIESATEGPGSADVLFEEAFDGDGAEAVLLFDRGFFEGVYPDQVWPEAADPEWVARESSGGGGLFLTAPSAALATIALQDGEAPFVAEEPAGLVRVELAMLGDPRLAPRVYEVRTVPTEEQLRDPLVVQREVWPELGLRHNLRRDPGGEPGRLSAVFEPRATTRALLFFASALRDPIVLEHLRIERRQTGGRRPRPLPDELAHERAARIEIAGSSRESIVVALPASVEFTVQVPPSLDGGSGSETSSRVPSGAPRFSMHVGAPDGNAAAVEVELVVSAADRAPLRRTVLLEPTSAPVWRAFEASLQDFAGKEVALSLRAVAAESPRAPGSDGTHAVRPVRLAFGNPTLEGPAVSEDALPPDLLLVSLDTVRRDRVGLYGGPRATTPNLDALAADGVTFDCAISPTSWTLPAHVSAFTGDLPGRHGVERKVHRLAPERGEATLAARLRSAGYETLAFTGGGLVGPDFGLAAGFEQYSTTELVNYGQDGERAVRLPLPARGERLFERLRGERRRPLFVFLHTYGAHNYTTSEADLRAIGVEPSRAEALRDRLQQGVLAAMATKVETDPRDLRDVYDATVFGVDALLGQALEALRDGGRMDSTFAIVFSDHGEELLEHGRVGHDLELHEELLRVPLVFHGPGLVPARIEQVVSLCDIAPTVTDLLLRGRPLGSDGRSLAPLLHGDSLAARPVLAQVRSTAELHALRSARYKLVLRLRDGEVVERRLYDLELDPGEEADLSGSEPALAEAFERQLLERIHELGPGSASPVELELSPERIQELRDLGYL